MRYSKNRVIPINFAAEISSQSSSGFESWTFDRGRTVPVKTFYLHWDNEPMDLSVNEPIVAFLFEFSNGYRHILDSTGDDVILENEGRYGRVKVHLPNQVAESQVVQIHTYVEWSDGSADSGRPISINFEVSKIDGVMDDLPPFYHTRLEDIIDEFREHIANLEVGPQGPRGEPGLGITPDMMPDYLHFWVENGELMLHMGAREGIK